MRYSGIGGQAVMEGVMMKNQEKYAVAVRKPDHEIEVKVSEYTGIIRNKKTLKRINGLIKDIQRNSFEGIGKPEPLKENLSGLWSRRIDDTNRIVYYEKDDIIYIVSCKGHYDD